MPQPVMTDPVATARAYQLIAAHDAGVNIGKFPSESVANDFYKATNGPMPFADKLFNNDRQLTSIFITGFLASFNATGFNIYMGPIAE